MEHKAMPKRIVMGALALCGLMVASAWLRGESGDLDVRDEELAHGYLGVVGSRPNPAGPHAAVRPPRASPAEQASAELARGVEFPIKMPPQIIDEILEEDKKLGLFMHYHRTVLLDEPGRKEYQKILSNPETLTAMAKDMMAPGQGAVEAKEHYHRLMQTDFLEAALHWKDNPERQRVLELTRSIILQDNFSSGQDLDRRQMLAGNKMELYRLLYENDMKQALDLVEQAKGTRMEALTGWMAKNNLEWRAREAEILAEMKAQQTGKQ